jgi:hypothetical protein
MMLDQSLSQIIEAANADDAEDVALRSCLVAAFRATTLFPGLAHDLGWTEMSIMREPLATALGLGATA